MVEVITFVRSRPLGDGDALMDGADVLELIDISESGIDFKERLLLAAQAPNATEADWKRCRMYVYKKGHESDHIPLRPFLEDGAFVGLIERQISSTGLWIGCIELGSGEVFSTSLEIVDKGKSLPES